MVLEQKPQTQSNMPMLIALVLLVVVFLGVFFFVMPQYSRFQDNNTMLLQKQTELNSVKTQISRMESLESSFKGGEVTKKDVLNLIPDDINQDEIIKTLAKTAEENEVSLNSLSFSVSKGKEIEAEILTITTNISGKHSDLINFLDTLESSSRKYKVNTISVQTLENRLENMSLNIEAYFI